MITDPCDSCSGNGHVPGQVSVDIKIPPGVDNGNRVRISGQGEPSLDGGSRGDCYCLIHVEEHELFKRDGDFLVLEMPITYSQSVLGSTIEVPTLEGLQPLVIPAGTPLGKVFRISGYGMPNPHNGQKGELLVQTYIEVPTRTNPKHEELLRELAEMEDVHVTPERRGFLEKIKDYFASREMMNEDEEK